MVSVAHLQKIVDTLIDHYLTATAPGDTVTPSGVLRHGSGAPPDAASRILVATIWRKRFSGSTVVGPNVCNLFPRNQ